MRVALDTGGGSREHHAAVLLRQHPLDRLLTDQEAAEGGGHQGLFDLGRIEFSDRTAGAITRIVDHDLGRAEGTVEVGEQLLHIGSLAGIAGKGLGVDLLGQTVEVGRRARRQRHLDAFGAEHPCQRRAETRPRAHDQRGVELHIGHCKSPERLERHCRSVGARTQ